MLGSNNTRSLLECWRVVDRRFKRLIGCFNGAQDLSDRKGRSIRGISNFENGVLDSWLLKDVKTIWSKPPERRDDSGWASRAKYTVNADLDLTLID